MTISTPAVALSFAGDDSINPLSIPWKYFAKSHVVAILRGTDGTETTWVLDTDYTLTEAGVEAGGTLTPTVAPATGETTVITLEPPNTQEIDIPRGGQFPASSVEDALDQAAQRDSKLEDFQDRVLHVPKTDTRSGSQLELPNETDRASQFAAYDSNGDPIAAAGTSADLGPVSAYINTLLDNADIDTALQTLGMSDADIRTFVQGSLSSNLLTFIQAADYGAALKLADITRKNLVINGDMKIFQRQSDTYTGIVASVYTMDRMEYIDTGTTAAVVTITQDTDVPTVAEAGVKFMNSLKIDVTTAEDLVGANAAIYLSHKIEAQDCTFFGHGATGALSAKLSFWFKSTKTGIFTVNVDRDDATEKYSTEFTVGTTNTWEQHTVTVPGDTSGTAIADDNGIGLALQFMLAVGATGKTSTADAWNASGATELATSNQVNLLDNASNNILYTGVQYEPGSSVTNFEQRPYSEELTRCHRYYQRFEIISGINNALLLGAGQAGATDAASAVLLFFTPMRAAPSSAAVFSADAFEVTNSAAIFISVTGSVIIVSSETSATIFATGVVGSPLTAGHATIFRLRVNEWLEFNAEL